MFQLNKLNTWILKQTVKRPISQPQSDLTENLLLLLCVNHLGNHACNYKKGSEDALSHFLHYTELEFL